MTTQSLWGEAIGNVATVESVEKLLGLSTDEVLAMVDNNLLIAITSAEGDILMPWAQFGSGGNLDLTEEVRWILEQLEPVLDRYMLCSWLNRPLEALYGFAPWEVLNAVGLDADLRGLVLRLAHRMSV